MVTWLICAEIDENQTDRLDKDKTDNKMENKGTLA